MTRKDYIEELNILFHNLSDDDKKEAINYCNEYFDEAGEDKIDIAIKELGSPKQFAAQVMGSLAIKEDNYKKEKNEKHTTKGNIKTIWLVILAILAFPIGAPILISVASALFGIVISVIGILFSISLVAFIIVFILPLLLLFGFPIASIPFSLYYPLTIHLNGFMVAGIIFISISIFIFSSFLIYVIIKNSILIIKNLIIFIYNKVRGNKNTKTFN